MSFYDYMDTNSGMYSFTSVGSIITCKAGSPLPLLHLGDQCSSRRALFSLSSKSEEVGMCDSRHLSVACPSKHPISKAGEPKRNKPG